MLTFDVTLPRIHEEDTLVPDGTEDAPTEEVPALFEGSVDTIEVDTAEVSLEAEAQVETERAMAYLVEVHATARSARLLAIRASFAEAQTLADHAAPDADVVVRELALPCDAEAIRSAAAGRGRTWRRPAFGAAFEPTDDPHATLLIGGF